MERSQVGFGFFPTDEELINHHLMSKVRGYTDHCVIPELEDFYASDPWDLPGLYPGICNVPSDGENWFFFCPSPYLAQNSERVKRKTRSGKWKITCERDDIKARDTGVIIGSKRILVFYKGRAKTGWVMHEYNLSPVRSGYSSIIQVPYILCRLKRKPSERLDPSPSFGGGSSIPDDTPAAAQYGSTEDTDQESSFQATMELLPPFQTLDNNIPDYEPYPSFNEQHYAYGHGQGNDFWGESWNVNNRHY